MAVISSISLCARITLDLHNLNNEGTEGNQQQTRMVHIIDQNGRRAIVNAVSGDMVKHILVEHLVPLLEEAKQPLSPGAKVYSADRINALNDDFNKFCDDKKVTESEIMTRMLTDCSLTDMAGALITRGRAVGRKSIVEFGWIVGLPAYANGEPVTTTEQYFHVKYALEGRGGATGGDTVAEKQAIFHRPASSGIYALICNLDLYRIGLNDITRQAVVGKADRTLRAKALIHALAATLLKPAGAQRNTQNPHIVDCKGIIATSATSLPAPTVSPLRDDYENEITKTADVLNGIRPASVSVTKFGSLSGGVKVLADFAAGVELPS